MPPEGKAPTPLPTGEDSFGRERLSRLQFSIYDQFLELSTDRIG